MQGSAVILGSKCMTLGVGVDNTETVRPPQDHILHEPVCEVHLSNNLMGGGVSAWIHAYLVSREYLAVASVFTPTYSMGPAGTNTSLGLTVTVYFPRSFLGNYRYLFNLYTFLSTMKGTVLFSENKQDQN